MEQVEIDNDNNKSLKNTTLCLGLEKKATKDRNSQTGATFHFTTSEGGLKVQLRTGLR